MSYFVQIDENSLVVAVTESDASLIDKPNIVEVDSLDASLIGKRLVIGEGGVLDFQTVPVTPIQYQKLRKVSFQERFPRSSNGVSTKYDLMSFFLVNDEYAASLGVTSTQRMELRILITAGMNRINSSTHVDLSSPDAANFTGLLTQQFIPEAFRLTPTERASILNPVLQTSEMFV